MFRFDLTYRELLTTYSCVSTLAAVQGTVELEDLAIFYANIIADVSNWSVASVGVELGRGDS